jgi:hypothetical protein
MQNEYSGDGKTIHHIQPNETILNFKALNQLKKGAMMNHLQISESCFEQYCVWEKKFNDCRKEGFKTEESKNKIMDPIKDSVDKSCKESKRDPAVLIIYNSDIKVEE